MPVPEERGIFRTRSQWWIVRLDRSPCDADLSVQRQWGSREPEAEPNISRRTGSRLSEPSALLLSVEQTAPGPSSRCFPGWRIYNVPRG